MKIIKVGKDDINYLIENGYVFVDGVKIVLMINMDIIPFR